MPGVGTIKGIPVAPGLAHGVVRVVRAAPDQVPTWTVPSDRVEDEVQRFQDALDAASSQFLRQQRIVAAEAGEKDAEIFAVHRMLLQDAGALDGIRSTIRDERINAEAAVQGLITRLETSLGGRLDQNSVRSFAADVTDPWRSVLEALLTGGRQQVLSSETPVLLAAAELTPQVMTFIERSRLLGVMTQTGGRYSHGAVLARAFGVPCVVGVQNLLNRLEQGMPALLDGDRGLVQLRPSPEDVREFEQRKDHLDSRRQALARDAIQPAVTSDGQSVQIQVNIESLRDLEMFDPATTDGVGLLRTEFLYMERTQFPSEEEQYRLYRRVLERMGDRPLVLRTLDIGGDKQLAYFKTPQEHNPALGWRGIRISLQWADLLRVQLSAALRAGVGADLRILLPMVSSIEEVRQTRAIFESVRADLLEHGYDVSDDVPVGIMVEVPSILLVLPEILKEVDFVSVGTNDLVQYLLAVDRDNAWVSKLYEPHHPAVFEALRIVAEGARAAGKPCGICGDLADDPAVALTLLGLGFDSISVAPNFLPEIKYAIRFCTSDEARELARHVLEQRTVAEVSQVLSQMRDRIHGSVE